MLQHEIQTQSFIDYFEGIKKIDTFSEIMKRAWVLGEEEGYLIPLTRCHLNSKPMIQLLADWRSKNQDAYPTQFPVTLEGTSKWLDTQVVHNSKRVLFLVLSQEGWPIGHLGYNNMVWGEKRELEIDNVVRGEKDHQAGLMTVAMRTLLQQTHVLWKPDRIYLRVFHDNQHAVNFYKRLGFIFTKAIPLRKEIESDVIRFVPIENEKKADRIFDVMEWRRS